MIDKVDSHSKRNKILEKEQPEEAHVLHAVNCGDGTRGCHQHRARNGEHHQSDESSDDAGQWVHIDIVLQAVGFTAFMIGFGWESALEKFMRPTP